MKKFITNLYGHGIESTAMNAQNMMAGLAKPLGYTELGVRGHNSSEDTDTEREKRIEGILAPMSGESLVIVQVPTWNGIAFDEVLIRKIRERATKVVVFIHDFVPLMFTNNRYLMSRYLEAYNLSDLVVLPSEKMAQTLQAEGLIAPIMFQGPWDHVSSIENLQVPIFEKKFKFAGNITRFPFVGEWDKLLPLEVYSSSVLEDRPFLRFKGWKHDDTLLRSLNEGGFGLVWSENIENQDEREYSEMNVSFKFSTYLAAGLPLIVNRGLAKESFVREQGLGLVVDSLDEAVSLVTAMTEEEYRILQGRVQRISALVKEGFFAKKLLIDIQSFLYLGEKNDNL